jgi:hypothetical protein
MNNNIIQQQQRVYANSICIILISLEGEETYFVNISGELTESERLFFQYIGKPDNHANRKKWGRSVDMANMFLELLQHDMTNNYQTFLNHLDDDYNILDISMEDLESISDVENQEKWLSNLDREEFNKLTNNGQYRLRVVVVNENDIED